MRGRATTISSTPAAAPTPPPTATWEAASLCNGRRYRVGDSLVQRQRAAGGCGPGGYLQRDQARGTLPNQVQPAPGKPVGAGATGLAQGRRGTGEAQRTLRLAGGRRDRGHALDRSREMDAGAQRTDGFEALAVLAERHRHLVKLQREIAQVEERRPDAPVMAQPPPDGQALVLQPLGGLRVAECIGVPRQLVEGQRDADLKVQFPERRQRSFVVGTSGLE